MKSFSTNDPLGPPPRSVRVKRTTQRNLLLSILISVAGVALCLFLLRQVQRQEEQQARRSIEGEYVQGKVTKKYSRRNEEKRAGAIVVESTFHVDYEFTAEGRTIRGIGRIRKGVWDKLQEGGPVGVYYTVGNPTVHELAAPNDARNRKLGKVMLYACGALVMVFLLATIDYLNRIRREQRQLRGWAVSADGLELVHPANRTEKVRLDKIRLVEID